MALLTFKEWVSKYNNKATDWDSVPEKDPIQCVDLAKIYVQECLGVKTKGKGVSAWGDARNWYENFESIKPLQKVCFKIPNTKAFVPIKGDICVFTENNKFGHISIAEGTGDTKSFITYDQNFNGKAMKKVRHTYTKEGFLGVLRPYRKVIKTVNVRKGPGTQYAVVGEKVSGSMIAVYELDKTGRWAKIGKNQYVAISYIATV